MSAPQGKVAEALERNKKLAEQAAAVASGDAPAPTVVEIKPEQPVEALAPVSIPKAVPVAKDSYTPVVGSFKRLVDKKIFGSNGNPLVADSHGYYQPKSQEEQEMLAHYASMARPFVEEVK